MFTEGQLRRSWIKFFWLFTFIFFISASSFLHGQNQEEKAGAGKGPPLIKIKLLPGKEMTLPPVLRDIFSPQVYSAPVSISSSRKQDAGAQQKMPGKQSGEEEAASNETVYRPSIRYIGYVHAEGKTIALLIVNGLALPVEPGEYITPEFQVVRISPEEVIVTGPDKKEIRFSLEGEKNEEI
jgi:hypothetical protein